jgi:hypothetical protein
VCARLGEYARDPIHFIGSGNEAPEHVKFVNDPTLFAHLILAVPGNDRTVAAEALTAL